jgi:HTH-type transcriptional regulator / antitoxin HigA
MNVKPIKTKADYQDALARVERLMSAKLGTNKGDELDVLATLVEAYERKHFPIATADPVEAILFRIEEQGLKRKDLEPFIGSRHRVSEVLNRKRSLSIEMIRRLHSGLQIPLETLVGEVA